MPDTRLYVLTVPAASQVDAADAVRSRQALQGILGNDVGNVDSIATEPGERPLTVEFPDPLAQIRGAELRELGQGLDQPLPVYRVDERAPSDGYYTVSRSRAAAVDPRSTDFQRVTLDLSLAGTPASHYRRIATRPTPVDHPFGTTAEALIGLPTTATKARWLNPETGVTEGAAPQVTASARLINVDVFDATDASFEAPSLLYELPFGDEGLVDPRVFDPRGSVAPTDSPIGADGQLVWQKVFAASHPFVSDVVVENGLIRLVFDESGNSITAANWDPLSSDWNTVSLGSSDWELFDLDLRDVGTQAIRARVEFRDPTQSPTAYHAVRMVLTAGMPTPLWYDADGTIPAGLVTLLDPVALERDVVPGAQAGLWAREDLA